MHLWLVDTGQVQGQRDGQDVAGVGHVVADQPLYQDRVHSTVEPGYALFFLLRYVSLGEGEVTSAK